MIDVAEWRDPDRQEQLAKASYYRERADEAAADLEQTAGEHVYMALAWESLSDLARRPYRTAVAVCCAAFVEALTDA